MSDKAQGIQRFKSYSRRERVSVALAPPLQRRIEASGQLKCLFENERWALGGQTLGPLTKSRLRLRSCIFQPPANRLEIR